MFSCWGVSSLSSSLSLQQRSSTLMWRWRYKMWRAQPLLSGATCPAGSKTSCCESFIIFRLNSPRLSFCTSLAVSSAFILFIYSPLQLLECFFFFIARSINPFFHSSIPSALYPCIVSHSSSSTHPHIRLQQLPSSFSSALPRRLCPLSSSFSTLAPSQPLSPLLCHFLSTQLLDLHLLSPSSSSASSTLLSPTYSPSTSYLCSVGIISNISHSIRLFELVLQ